MGPVQHRSHDIMSGQRGGFPCRTEIGHLRFYAFHRKPDSGICRKSQFNCAAWAVTGNESYGKKRKHIIRLVLINAMGLYPGNPVEMQGRAATLIGRLAEKTAFCLFPDKAVRCQHEAFFTGEKSAIRNFQNGILKMSGQDLQILLVQGYKL